MCYKIKQKYSLQIKVINVVSMISIFSIILSSFYLLNIPTSKFYNKPIYSNIKHNGVKLIIQSIQFAMLRVYKMETVNAGINIFLFT